MLSLLQMQLQSQAPQEGQARLYMSHPKWVARNRSAFCPTLLCPALPCLAPPYPALSCTALPCTALCPGLLRNRLSPCRLSDAGELERNGAHPVIHRELDVAACCSGSLHWWMRIRIVSVFQACGSADSNVQCTEERRPQCVINMHFNASLESWEYRVHEGPGAEGP